MASQIDLLTGDAPLRTQSQAVFDQNMNNFMSEFPAMIPQFNTVATEAEADAAAAEAARVLAQAAQAAAEDARDEAEDFAQTAVLAPGSSGTATNSLAIPTSGLPVSRSFSGAGMVGKNFVVGMQIRFAVTAAPENYMQGNLTAYDNVTGAGSVNVTDAQGSGTYSAWTIHLAAPIISTVSNVVQSKPTNFTAYKQDKGAVFECAASLTAAIDALSSVEQGWYAYYTAPASGTVTIDPNGSEQIGGPGLTTGNTQTISNGESCVVVAGASSFTMIKFQTPAGMRLLAAIVPTASASVSFLSTFTSDFDDYTIIGHGLKPASDAILQVHVGQSGTADTGSNYYTSIGSAGSTATTTAPTMALINAAITSAGTGMSFELKVKNANATTAAKHLVSEGHGQSGVNTYRFDLAQCAYVGTSAASGVRFNWSTGANFAAQGLILVFGMRKS